MTRTIKIAGPNPVPAKGQNLHRSLLRSEVAMSRSANRRLGEVPERPCILWQSTGVHSRHFREPLKGRLTIFVGENSYCRMWCGVHAGRTNNILMKRSREVGGRRRWTLRSHNTNIKGNLPNPQLMITKNNEIHLISSSIRTSLQYPNGTGD